MTELPPSLLRPTARRGPPPWGISTEANICASSLEPLRAHSNSFFVDAGIFGIFTPFIFIVASETDSFGLGFISRDGSQSSGSGAFDGLLH